MFSNTPRLIERQEKRGQQDLVGSEALPIKMSGATRAHLEAFGFKFGQDLDDLFVQAQLPPGWKKQASDHSMWSYLIDNQGRTRASIFFKAAFYDRDAFMSFTPRFSISKKAVVGDDQYRPGAQVVVVVVDKLGNAEVFKSQMSSPKPDGYNREWSDEIYALSQTAVDFLRAHYPDYENPLAYWG